jgi:hypothetical protein
MFFDPEKRRIKKHKYWLKIEIFDKWVLKRAETEYGLFPANTGRGKRPCD